MRTDTARTSRNSRPFVFCVRATRPDSNAPVALTTPIRPPRTRMKTMMSIASMVPLTIEPVISSTPCGFCGMRSYVPGIDTGLSIEPDVNFSTSILTPRSSRFS